MNATMRPIIRRNTVEIGDQKAHDQESTTWSNPGQRCATVETEPRAKARKAPTQTTDKTNKQTKQTDKTNAKHGQHR